MALLFTVVLSAYPSRISQSHNPLFIPTEAQSVCKWTWVMADRERPTSPPIQASHAASNRHGKTYSFPDTHTYTVYIYIYIRALAQTTENESE